MTSDELIERTAAAIAPRYDELDFSDCAGVLLHGSWGVDLTPMALELREGEVTPTVSRDGYQEELGSPVVPDELGRELVEHIEQAPDGYVSTERYWLALAGQLHVRLGMPVLVVEIEMPIAEQLARQRGAPSPDPLAGLDVDVSQRIDAHRMAAVWLDQELEHVASSRAPQDPQPLSGPNDEISRDPEVRAGWLPPGVAAVELQDREDVWHKARVGTRAWLCVLPQRSGQRHPDLRYRDVDGTQFDLRVETDVVPRLWPRQAPGLPEYDGGGEGFVSLVFEDWRVEVTGTSGYPGVALRPIAGSVLGEPHGFGVERVGNGWRAIGTCGTFRVDVAGPNEPPSRLDLHEQP